MAEQQNPKNAPSKDERDEAGIHKQREAISEGAAKTPTQGEPQSEADRRREDRPEPASKPRE